MRGDWPKTLDELEARKKLATAPAPARAFPKPRA
jgi:hypothetical protein